MRILFSIALAALAGLSSCKNDQSNGVSNKPPTTQHQKVLPSSGGGQYEVAVAGEGITKNTALKILFDSMLGVEVPALPQPESLFHPDFIEINRFQSLFKRNMKIIFLANSASDDPVIRYLDDNLSPGILAEIPKGSSGFKILQNVWSEPQVICLIYAPKDKDYGNIAWHNKDFIIEAFKDNTKASLRSILYQKSPRIKIINRLKKNHRFAFDVPKYYQLIMESYPGFADTIRTKYNVNGFLWFRAETKKSNNNIMIYYVDYDEKILTQAQKLFDLKTRVNKIVGSEKKGAYMSVDTVNYSYFIKNTKLKYVNAIELRGLWQMENDWMGGPYITYFIPDSKNKRIIVLDAFVYAPGTSKKPFISRLETILETFKIY